MNLNKYKNIFLDRDGVINSIVQRNDVISSPRSIKEFKIRDDFVMFSNNLKEKGFLFFVCTNQPDISRNLLDLNELKKMHAVIEGFIDLTEIVYCPHDDYDSCLCRKPLPGMINSMITKYNLKREECLIIGDSYKDISAGNNAHIDTCLLETIYNKHVKCANRIHKLTDLKIQ